MFSWEPVKGQDTVDTSRFHFCRKASTTNVGFFGVPGIFDQVAFVAFREGLRLAEEASPSLSTV